MEAEIDVNHMLAREQISLVRAKTAPHEGARRAHEGLARAYHETLAEHLHPHPKAEPIPLP